MAPPSKSPKGSGNKPSPPAHSGHAEHAGHSATAAATATAPAPATVTRLEVTHLTQEQLQNYRNGIAQMQAISDNRGFQVLAGYHGVPNFYCHHGDSYFLPWHRAYLYQFEQYLRDRVSNTAIPWWDWTAAPAHASGIPPAFGDAKDASGKPNPLLDFKVDIPQSKPPLVGQTKRAPHPPADLPTAADVQDALSREEFLDFSGALEQIHNNLHGWVGGWMGVIPKAAFDPIFYSHHCMIDRIWYLWQIKNGVNNIPPNLLNYSLTPFGMQVSQTLDISQLGYGYALSQVSG